MKWDLAAYKRALHGINTPRQQPTVQLQRDSTDNAAIKKARYYPCLFYCCIHQMLDDNLQTFADPAGSVRFGVQKTIP